MTYILGIIFIILGVFFALVALSLWGLAHLVKQEDEWQKEYDPYRFDPEKDTMLPLTEPVGKYVSTTDNTKIINGTGGNYKEPVAKWKEKK